MKTLLLVDGSSYLYRAYHALPDLLTQAGEPTGATYGVLNMLRRLRQDNPSDYLACIFDAPGSTFRNEIYPDYKANRPSMPDDLRVQIPAIHDAVRAMGWPLWIIQDVEADDVIGSLSQAATQKGWSCLISTGDKDLAQLVNAHVSLINTMTNEFLDTNAVFEKFGVKPNQIVDYLTLIGDSADNVPGISKVGPKTAVKWLKQYESLDHIISSAHEIKGVVGQNLRDNLNWLPTARKLLTICCDVPFPEDIETLTQKPIQTEYLKTLFQRYEFKTWLRELNEHPSDIPLIPLNTPQVSPPEKKYETVLTKEHFQTWFQQINLAALTSIDTETTSLNSTTAQLVGISLCTTPGLAAYIPLQHCYPGVPDQLDLKWTLTQLKPWLESEQHLKVGQNLKYDIHIFKNHGITLRGIAHDTLLASYVLEPHQRHDMDSLAERHLGIKTIPYETVCGSGKNKITFDQVDLEQATLYAAEDADITLQLHTYLQQKLQQTPTLQHVYKNIELPALQVVYQMERKGVLLDVNTLREQAHTLGQRLLTLEQEAHALVKHPFNLSSPQQLQEVLFNEMKLPITKKTPKGAASTDEEVLSELAHDYPLPRILMEHRQLSKLKTTYTDKLPQSVNPNTHRVHTHYAQAAVITGRLSSSEPNLQNIPVRTPEGRRIRKAFIAPPHWKIVSADYSQIELRIMAHLSNDVGLCQAFSEGADIHRATAAEILNIEKNEVSSEQRRWAKAVNFGLIYGMSAFGLAKQLGIDRHTAQQFIDRYFARYPGVATYMEKTRQQAHQQGYVETLFGRRLWLPNIHSKNAAHRAGAERTAINAPMQGTAADLIKIAMVNVQQWIIQNQYRARLIMQVHDELVIEAPTEEIEQLLMCIPNIMNTVTSLHVPLQTDIGVGLNWEEAHS